MILNTIAKIKAHQFVGNAMSDARAFADIDSFVRNNENQIADRAEVLRIMFDKGMGLGRYEHRNDSQVLSDYFAD